MSRPFQRNIGPVVAINTKLLSCALLAGATWYLWPASWLEGWRSGVLAVFAACGAIMSLVQALKAMIQLYTRDRAIAEFQELGAKPKSSRMASHDALKAAGMIDG